jgi:hypothetical protein
MVAPGCPFTCWPGLGWPSYQAGQEALPLGLRSAVKAHTMYSQGVFYVF